MAHFVDRSNQNGADDYAQAKVETLYLKATEGVNFVDGTRDERRREAEKAGVDRIGDYHFADLNDPTSECDWFLSVIGTTPVGQLRPALDLERNQSAAWAEQWILRFHAKRGYLPTFYASTSYGHWLRQRSKLVAKCPWWRAEYGPDDGQRHSLIGGRLGAVAHQYTSKSEIAGISGYTDESVWLGSRTPMLVPAPRRIGPVPRDAWPWAQWKLGIGKWKGHKPGDPAFRQDWPKRVPWQWWRAVAWYKWQGLA